MPACSVASPSTYASAMTADGGRDEDDRSRRLRAPGGRARRRMPQPLMANAMRSAREKPSRLACHGPHGLDSILPEVMRILLTNDDGIGSPLLAALAAALDDARRRRRDRARERHDGRLALAQPGRAHRRRRGRRWRTGAPAFAVIGTPADCVRFGSLGLAGGTPGRRRLRAQPGHQPGRRRRVLRHGRGGARGRPARPARGRALAAGVSRRQLRRLGALPLRRAARAAARARARCRRAS